MNDLIQITQINGAEVNSVNARAIKIINNYTKEISRLKSQFSYKISNRIVGLGGVRLYTENKNENYKDSLYCNIEMTLDKKKITIGLVELMGEEDMCYCGSETYANKIFTAPLDHKKLDKWLIKVLGRKLDTKGKIYLITDGEYTKIGATSYNTKKRLNELQTGNPKKLIEIGNYNVNNKITTEKMLHDKYAHKHILGEWFKLNSIDINNILLSQEQIVYSSKYQVVNELIKSEIDKALIQISYDADLAVFKLQKRLLNKLIDLKSNLKTVWLTKLLKAEFELDEVA